MKTKILSVLFIVVFFTRPAAGQNLNHADSLNLMSIFKAKALQWKDAYNSKDADNLVPLYTQDAQYISSHVAGLVADGRTKLIENFQNGMNLGGHIDSLEIIKMEFSSNLASLVCKY